MTGRGTVREGRTRRIVTLTLVRSVDLVSGNVLTFICARRGLILIKMQDVIGKFC